MGSFVHLRPPPTTVVDVRIGCQEGLGLAFPEPSAWELHRINPQGGTFPGQPGRQWPHLPPGRHLHLAHQWPSARALVTASARRRTPRQAGLCTSWRQWSDVVGV